MKIHAVVLSAGSGGRFGSDDVLKQYIKLAGEPVLFHTVKIFEDHPKIESIIVVSNKGSIDFVRSLVKEKGFTKIKVVEGGLSRQESSKIGIRALDASPNDLVLIHDSVRPFVSTRIIDDMIDALSENEAVDVAIPSADTLIQIKGRFIEKIPDRSFYMRGQTPQGFVYHIIKEAHELAEKNNDTSVTDDCGLVIRYCGSKVFVVLGDDINIKITFPLDIHIADKIFQLRSMRVGTLEKSSLRGKTIIVFGHSSGIGRAIYNLCKENGAKVYGFSRSNGVDITDYKLVAQVLKNAYIENGSFDAVISTVGILIRKNFHDLTDEEVLNQISVNYIGTIMLAKAVTKYMKKNSHMLFFSSSSYTRGRAGYAVYSSLKSALVNFVQALADELYDRGIYVNIMCPSRTDTSMRRDNFPDEDRSLLLDARTVAEQSLSSLFYPITGQVIDVRKK